MSVVVKGMKMPENCENCPIREGTFCDIINKDIDRFYSGAIKRDPDCPLVGLPEKHGRLIDAEELIETAEFYETEMDIKNHSKTVIEAEGE